MHRLAYLCCLGASACRVISSNVVDNDPALAKFTGPWTFRQDIEAGSIHGFSIILPGADCNELPGDTIVTLDGIDGRKIPGEEISGGWFPPELTWTYFPTEQEVSTVVVADVATTWQFEIDRPFIRRTFAQVSPAPGTPVHSGDMVELSVTPPTTAVSAVLVSLVTNEDSVSLNDLDDVMVNGGDVSVTIPAHAAAPSARIVASGTASLSIPRCDAPGGCNGSAPVAADFGIDLEDASPR